MTTEKNDEPNVDLRGEASIGRRDALKALAVPATTATIDTELSPLDGP